MGVKLSGDDLTIERLKREIENKTWCVRITKEDGSTCNVYIGIHHGNLVMNPAITEGFISIELLNPISR